MNGAGSIPDYIAERVRRPHPAGGRVVPRSTPVISFGDHTRARVASVGINPSRLEFQTNAGALLAPGHKRLADLDVFGVLDVTDLNDRDVDVVLRWCQRYFTTRPYRLWFDKLNTCVRGTGADFYDGTACHLDLVQWATDPVWGSFPAGDRGVQEQLLQDDADFLRRQLASPNLEVVLLNGKQVVDQLQRLDIVTLTDVGPTPVGNRGRESRLLEGRTQQGAVVLGWTLNSGHPQTTQANRVAVAEWVASRLR